MDPIDLKEVLERVQNDKELLKELLDIFLQDCPQKVKAIKEAYQAKNMTQLKDAAHSMKGASGNISAKQLYALFSALDQKGRNDDFSGVDVLIADLDRELKVLEEYSHKLKQELS